MELELAKLVDSNVQCRWMAIMMPALVVTGQSKDLGNELYYAVRSFCCCVLLRFVKKFYFQIRPQLLLFIAFFSHSFARTL